MANRSTTDRFNDNYSRFQKIDFKTLFENQSPEMIDVLDSISKMKERFDKTETVKNELGDQILNQVAINLQQFLSNFERLLPPFNKTNVEARLPSMLIQISSLLEQSNNWWPTILTFVNNKLTSPEISKIVSENNKINEEIRKQKDVSEGEAKRIEDLRVNLESKLSLLENRYSSSIDAAELDKQKNLFQVAADKNKSNSRCWLVGIILSIILTFLILYILFNDFCFNLNCFSIDDLSEYKTICEACPRNILAYEIIKGALFRILIISMSLFIIRFCIKNYNAQMHQYSVNLQKMNSFDVALAFITKSTPEGKDKVMTLAAQTIFSHYKTGYSNKGPEEGTQTIIEKVVDKASDKFS